MMLKMNLQEYRSKHRGKSLKEKEITKQIRDYLKVKNIFHWKVLQGLGAKRGISDILGILPGGRALAIEIKTEKGVLTKHQEEFIREAKEQGAKAFVARSVDDVIKEGI